MDLLYNNQEEENYFLLENNESYEPTQHFNFNIFSFLKYNSILDNFENMDKYFIFKENKEKISEYKCITDKIITLNISIKGDIINQIIIKCKIDNTIESIKKEIGELTGISDAINSTIKNPIGIILGNNSTLKDLYIFSDTSLIFLTNKKIKNIKIYIKKEKKVLEYEVQEIINIYNIKKMINEKEKIPIGNQNLLFNNKNLENDKFIYYYGIKDKSELNLEIKESTEKITIYFYDLYKKYILEKIYNKYELVKNIKKELKIILKESEDLFLFNGLNEFKDDDVLIKDKYKLTIYWYNEIYGEKSMVSTIIFSNEFNLGNNNKFQITFDPKYSLELLYIRIYFQFKKIVNHFNFGVRSFYLTFQTNILIGNNKSVCEFQIKNNSNIEIKKIKI